jgi:galactokinase
VNLFIESTVPVGAVCRRGDRERRRLHSTTCGAGFDRPTLAKVDSSPRTRPWALTASWTSQRPFSGAKTTRFLDCRSLESHLVQLGFAEAGLEVLVIDTGVKHSHATGGYASRRASCEAGAKALEVASLRDLTVDDLPRARALLDDETFRRVRHVVTENRRVLDTVDRLRTDGPLTIGELLDASHVSMRDDFEISV